MRVRMLVVVAVSVLVNACGSSNPSGPQHTPDVLFIAGNGQTDTIGAALNQALVVEVRVVPTGQTASNQIVQFTSVNDSLGAPEVYVEPLTSNNPTTFIADSTDAQGRTSVGIVLGTKAGRAQLLVKVPAFGYVDTATFTVTPGNATGIAAGPADTSVYVGHTATLHTAVVDRAGNPRKDPVTYAVISGPATISGATVTVTGYGQVQVAASAAASAATLKDTTLISGVPTGTIAASIDNGGGIVEFNLDGSGYKVITTTAAGTVAWAPSGNSIVFDQTSGQGAYGGSALLQSVTVGGTVSLLDNSGGPIDAWPAYSRDGQWIYYVKDGGGTGLWRVHSDGSGDAAVAMQNNPGEQFPSPSPDGTQIVYIVPGPGTMNILTLSTGVSAAVGSIVGEAAAWAPTGNLIAYLTGSYTLSIVHSDGTGVTSLGTTVYDYQFGWSPDGKWIIARNQATGKFDLLSTTSSLVVPVGFTGNMSSPSWH